LFAAVDAYILSLWIIWLNYYNDNSPPTVYRVSQKLLK
jgi:hypothetical protein